MRWQLPSRTGPTAGSSGWYNAVAMPQLVLQDFDQLTLDRLRQRAHLHAQPVETEARMIIEAELAKQTASEAEYLAKLAAFREWIDEFHAGHPPQPPRGADWLDSAALIREDRDSDHGRDP